MAALVGKISWFGGKGDPTDSGHTASGGTTAEPGIAVYNHKTLGGYWRVTAPNGKSVVLKQTDIGPAPWTNRKIDFTYSALPQLGYNEHNFPTNAVAKAEYLGSSPQSAKAVASRQISKVLQPVQREVATFNQAGFEQATNRAQANKLLGKVFRESGGIGRQGLFNTPIPERKSFQENSTASGTEPPIQQPGHLGQEVGATKAIIHEANHIAEAHVPYKWGGGHLGKTLPNTKVLPLDCSGAVSAALGIDPKVSGQFETWGKPGKGKVTVYANAKHVLLEINGHFWGTSASNPGGGAGWIKPGVISPSYLTGFTARHL